MTGMSDIVKTVSKIVVGVIFIYGIYIITHGHLTPGGGFAGGAIIAGAFILLILAYGKDVMKLKHSEEGTSLIESIAIFAFLAMAVIGFAFGTKVFFANYLPLGKVGELISAGLIPLYNIAIGIEVAAALLTIFQALVIFKEEAP